MLRAVRQRLVVAVIVAMALLALAPFTTLADNPPGLGVNVNVGVGGSNGGVTGNVGVNVGSGVNAGANVGVGNNGANANVGANVGNGSVANGNANVSVGGGSVANGTVDATVGGGSVASGSANVSVGGGSVANGTVDATVGGGSVANGNANANVGGGSVANGTVDATVGSSAPNSPVAAVAGNAGVGNNPTTGNSLVGTTLCVQVGGNCPGTTTAAPGAPLATGTLCLVVDGNCTPAGPVGSGSNPSVAGLNLCIAAPGSCTTSGTPASSLVNGTVCVVVDGTCARTQPANTTSGSLVNGSVCLVVDGNCTNPGAGANPSTAGVNICVVAAGTCDASGNPPPSLVNGTVCVVVDGVCAPTGATGSNGGTPVTGVNLCVALPGACDAGTPGSGGISGTVGTPIGNGGACVVILDTCSTTTTDPNSPTGGVTPVNPGGRTPPPLPGSGTGTNNPTGGVTPGGTIPGGTIPGGTIPGSGGIQIAVSDAAGVFANTGVTLNAQDNQSGLCSFPLAPFSRDAGLTADAPDCVTVHVKGQRGNGSGYGTTQDGTAAGASTGVLHDSGKVSADIGGTCAGCDSAYGSGSGYKAFVQLKDSATGDFINVGIAHDAAPNASGQSATGVTLVIETGRKTANGYDIAQGYIPATTNQVPSGHATIMLSWTAQGVAVYANGIIPPNESAARPIMVGTYNVHMSQPVASFAGAAKNAGDRVDATFNAISFG